MKLIVALNYTVNCNESFEWLIFINWIINTTTFLKYIWISVVDDNYYITLSICRIASFMDCKMMIGCVASLLHKGYKSTCHLSDTLKKIYTFLLVNDGDDDSSVSDWKIWIITVSITLRGQSLFRRHFLGVFVSNLAGLLCLLAVHSVLKVLVFTKRSSARATAFKRYLSTMNHVRKWYTEDVFDSNSR